MKLRRLRIHAYRSFLNQTLEIDPDVTVVAGRNDTGKTSVLYRFFDQYVPGRSSGSGDYPKVTGPGDRRLGFTATWDIAETDYQAFSLPNDFGEPGQHRLEMTFRDVTGPEEHWRLSLDGQPLQAYSHRSAETGHPVLKFSIEDLIPWPHYIDVGAIAASMFEMRLFELAPGWSAARPHDRPSQPERLLLRIGGLNAVVRNVQSAGIETPWPENPHLRTPGFTLSDVEQHLAALSDRITAMLQRWWADPRELTYRIRLAGNDDGKRRQHEINSYIVVSEILGKTKHTVLWFRIEVGSRVSDRIALPRDAAIPRPALFR
jgi:hypothetical protein